MMGAEILNDAAWLVLAMLLLSILVDTVYLSRDSDQHMHNISHRGADLLLEQIRHGDSAAGGRQ